MHIKDGYNVLIFDTETSGHNMEYLHHIYLGTQKRPNLKFIFVVPQDFEKKRLGYEWPKRSNVTFNYLTQEEIEATKSKSLLKKSWYFSKLLRYYIKRTSAKSVFLISLMYFIPFIGWFVSGKVNVSGIIYGIYLYTYKKSSKLTRILNVLKYKIISWTKCLKSVYILNDEFSKDYLNRVYRTTKFKYLSDPFNDIVYTPRFVREKYNVDNSRKLFIHFGSLGQRKGTIMILDTIMSMDKSILENSSFVFAGIIDPRLRDEFCEKLQLAQQKTEIFFYESFLNICDLYDLIYSSDCILIPYLDSSRSSGVIAYADKFKIPVIGPGDGILGKLIRKYRLGIGVKKLSIKTLAESISLFITGIPRGDGKYIKEHTIDEFNSIIFSNF